MKRGIFLLFLLLALGIFWLPQILSHPPGKSFLIWCLEKKTRSSISIDSVHLSWRGPQTLEHIRCEQLPLSAQAETLFTDLSLWSCLRWSLSPSNLPASGQIELKNGLLEVSSSSIAFEKMEATAQLSSEGVAFSLSQNAPSTTQQRLLIQGEVDKSHHLSGNIVLSSFPTVIVDHLFSVYQDMPKGLLLALLGSSLDLTANLQIQDKITPLQCKLSSPFMQGSIEGTYEENQLVLSKPSLATVQLSPQLLAFLAQKTTPFVGEIETNQPIELRIDEGFRTSLPLTARNLQGKGTLTLGKLQVRGKKIFPNLFDLLKEPSLKRKTSLWFTPIFFHVEKDTLAFERVDFLLDSLYPLCAWGTINWPREKLHLMLGIRAKTLESAFSLKHLPPNYVLPLQLKGSLQNPSLSTKKALARISALLLAEKLSKRHFPTPMPSDIPAPTSSIPWDGLHGS